MFFFTFFICAPNAHAQRVGDSLSIRFHKDSITIDMDFSGNRRRWNNFEHNFLRRYGHLPAGSLRLDIYSGASPEGRMKYNYWLGESRGEAIRQLALERLGHHLGDVVVHNEAARWNSFRQSIAASREPWRNEVLRIIDLPADTVASGRDHREVLLRQLQDGKVWPILVKRYLAPLRSGVTAVLSWQTPPADRNTIVLHDTVVVMMQNQPSRRDTIVIREIISTRDTLYIFSSDSRDSLRRDTILTPHKEQKPVVRRPAWILRTNLPLLGIGSPNVQAEWSIDYRDRWSFNLEFIGPWWTFGKNAYANELMYGSAELRHWLGRRSRHHTLDGFHVGLGIGGGYYDFEWKSKGYQGEAIMGFVNIGWQHRFGKRHQWAFDAGIGLGYLYSPYRRYLGSSLFPESHTERYDDHLMWQYDSRLNWIGTPHANISIGYVFMPRKGLYRRSKAMERDAIRTAIELGRDAIKERERQQRDSLYLEWYDMPKKQRKAARKAYKLEQKADRQKEKTKQKRKRK